MVEENEVTQSTRPNGVLDAVYMTCLDVAYKQFAVNIDCEGGGGG